MTHRKPATTAPPVVSTAKYKSRSLSGLKINFEYMDEGGSVILCGVVFFTLFVVGFMAIGRHIDSSQCALDGVHTGHHTYFEGGLLANGCFVEVDGEVIPHERWHVIEE